jgi:hypothetical protein
VGDFISPFVRHNVDPNCDPRKISFNKKIPGMIVSTQTWFVRTERQCKY